MVESCGVCLSSFVPSSYMSISNSHCFVRRSTNFPSNRRALLSDSLLFVLSYCYMPLSRVRLGRTRPVSFVVYSVIPFDVRGPGLDRSTLHSCGKSMLLYLEWSTNLDSHVSAFLKYMCYSIVFRQGYTGLFFSFMLMPCLYSCNSLCLLNFHSDSQSRLLDDSL